MVDAVMGIAEVVSGRSKLGRRWRSTGREHCWGDTWEEGGGATEV